jgi:hypothetical protein
MGLNYLKNATVTVSFFYACLEKYGKLVVNEASVIINQQVNFGL